MNTTRSPLRPREVPIGRRIMFVIVVFGMLLALGMFVGAIVDAVRQ